MTIEHSNPAWLTECSCIRETMRSNIATATSHTKGHVSEPTLQQTLTKKVLHEAALQIGAIDTNSKQIAECATLAERINAANASLHASPLVTVFTDSVYARVMVCYQPLSAVRDAICKAGLHINSEETLLDDMRDEIEIKFELVGYDCAVLITQIVDELIEDLAEAA